MALKSLSRDVVFEFSCNVSAVTVDYDPILMQEALTNIFENAFDGFGIETFEEESHYK